MVAMPGEDVMPPALKVDLTELEKFVGRVKQIPRWYEQVTRIIMDASLLIVWSEVPPYPAPPPNSSYKRTGTLGRTLGVSGEGGISGKPDIFGSKRSGREHIGRFGSRLNYAPYVIGQEQSKAHQGRWWTIREVRDAAEPKVVSAAQSALVSLGRAILGKISDIRPGGL